MGNWTRFDTRALIEAAEERPLMSMWVARTIRRHHGEPGLVARMARFEDFILATDGRPHIWGEADCSLVVADWVALNGYADPGSWWRGAYATEAECRALLARRGGLVAHIGACAADVGLIPIVEPEFGCIAVVGSARPPARQWSAIWNGFKWAVKWGDGKGSRWVPFMAPALAMWRV